jgi:hypothetical protein
MIFMKKQAVTFICTGIYICTLLLSGYGVYQISCLTCHQKQEEINDAFQSVIHRDRELRYKQTGNPFYTIRPSSPQTDASVITLQYKDEVITISKDSSYYALTHDEKMHLVMQYYLQKKKPVDVVVLDSLFRTELAQRALPTQTAVVCITKDSIYRSHPDTTLYASAIATDEIPVKLTEMTLQAYVHVPFGYWLKENRNIYFSALSFWVLMAGLLIGWRVYARKRKRRAIIPLETVEEEPLLIIAPGIFFDKKRGILSCKQTEVELHNLQLELFCSLLNAPGHFLSYAEMKKNIWHNKDTAPNTIHKCIRRLNDRLSSLSLSIRILPREGCEF